MAPPPKKKKRWWDHLHPEKQTERTLHAGFDKIQIKEAKEEKIQKGTVWRPRKQLFIRVQTQRFLSQCTYLNTLSPDHTVKSNSEGSEDVLWRTSCTAERESEFCDSDRGVGESTGYHSLSLQILFVCSKNKSRLSEKCNQSQCLRFLPLKLKSEKLLPCYKYTIFIAHEKTCNSFVFNLNKD